MKTRSEDSPNAVNPRVIRIPHPKMNVCSSLSVRREDSLMVDRIHWRYFLQMFQILPLSELAFLEIVQKSLLRIQKSEATVDLDKRPFKRESVFLHEIHALTVFTHVFVI
jgi:hypothetical protein